MIVILKKTFNILIIFLILVINCQAEFSPIEQIFIDLPDSLFVDLSKKQRSDILSVEKYYPADNDTNEVEVYEHKNNGNDDRLRVESLFKTDQRGFNNYDLKIFEKLNGDTVVVFSNYSGSGNIFSENRISVFNVKNGMISPNIKISLPIAFSDKDLIKANAPDTIVNEIHSLSYCYDLIDIDSGSIGLYLGLVWDENITPWLKANKIIFIWNGEVFDRKYIFDKD